MFRDDYVIRLIEQLGEALRRIRGLSSKRDFAAAVVAANEAWAKLFDVPRELVEVIDTPTLAAMLRDVPHIRAAARLLAEEGDALAGKGDLVHATLCRRRAMELYLEARAEPEPEDEIAFRALSRHVHANQLDPHYLDGTPIDG